MILTNGQDKFYRVRRKAAREMTAEEVADALAAAQATEAMLKDVSSSQDQPTPPETQVNQPDPNANPNPNPVAAPDLSQITPPSPGF